MWTVQFARAATQVAAKQGSRARTIEQFDMRQTKMLAIRFIFAMHETRWPRPCRGAYCSEAEWSGCPTREIAALQQIRCSHRTSLTVRSWVLPRISDQSWNHVWESMGGSHWEGIARNAWWSQNKSSTMIAGTQFKPCLMEFYVRIPSS